MSPDRLSCQELVEVVTDYLDGRLGREDAERFEHHLSICPFCVDYLEQIRALVRLGERERSTALPALVEHLLPAFRTYRRGLA